MSVVPVVIHVPGRTIRAELSTDHPASSYGQPVLALDGGPSFAFGALVAHGPGDVTRWGIGACLTLALAPEVTEPAPLLNTWLGMCRQERASENLPNQAITWLDSGGWTDGGSILRHHAGTRSLVEEMYDATPPLIFERVQHESDAGDVVELSAWRFSDDSGVIVFNWPDGGLVGGDRVSVATWDVIEVGGRTTAGQVVQDARVGS